MKKILILILFAASLSFANKEADIQKLFTAIQVKNNAYAKNFFEEKEKEKLHPYDVPVYVEEEEKLDVNVKNKEGYSPLIIAAMYNNLDMIKYLKEKGADFNVFHPILGRTILITAISYGSKDVALYLIDNMPELINIPSKSDAWLAIEEAVLKEDEQILRALLKKGAKVSENAFLLSTRHGKGKMVKILKDYVK